MNDSIESGAVRDSLARAMNALGDVHMIAPLDAIVRCGRARARRRRNRLVGLAGAAVVAAGAAPAAAALLPASRQPDYPSGHQAGHQVAARLTAWTVTEKAEGKISLTIRELRDPAGLQNRLRADGVPASVTFLGRPNPACHPYAPAAVHGAAGLVPAANPALLRATQGVIHLEPGATPAQGARFVIDASALKRGIGVQIGAETSPPGPAVPARARGWVGVELGLVHASPQCTG